MTPAGTGSKKAKAQSFILPAPIGAAGRHLPRFPASIALATALNVVLRRKLPPELFERLAGRKVAIEVPDLGTVMTFRIHGTRFIPCRDSALPDVQFRASAYDFASLAARQQDADTLFFNRRLMVEGDTELALLVKNSLDTVEAPHARRALRRILKLAEPFVR
jgi:predicted lipid carrier protein YhbT